MVVVEMPQSKPVITGGHQELPGAPKMKYKPGDVLNLTCTSAPSNPPAQLEWRLNDKKVCTSNAIKVETAILLSPQSKKSYLLLQPCVFSPKTNAISRFFCQTKDGFALL